MAIDNGEITDPYTGKVAVAGKCEVSIQFSDLPTLYITYEIDCGILRDDVDIADYILDKVFLRAKEKIKARIAEGKHG